MHEPKVIPRSESRLVLAFFALVFVAHTLVYPYLGAVNNPNDIVARHGCVNDMALAPETKMKPVIRTVLALAFVAAGVSPAFSKPLPDEDGDGGVMREVAERYGSRGPCAWLRLADMDRMVSQDMEAARDESHAGATKREACP